MTKINHKKRSIYCPFFQNLLRGIKERYYVPFFREPAVKIVSHQARIMLFETVNLLPVSSRILNMAYAPISL